MDTISAAIKTLDERFESGDHDGFVAHAIELFSDVQSISKTAEGAEYLKARIRELAVLPPDEAPDAGPFLLLTGLFLQATGLRTNAYFAFERARLVLSGPLAVLAEERMEALEGHAFTPYEDYDDLLRDMYGLVKSLVLAHMDRGRRGSMGDDLYVPDLDLELFSLKSFRRDTSEVERFLHLAHVIRREDASIDVGRVFPSTLLKAHLELDNLHALVIFVLYFLYVHEDFRGVLRKLLPVGERQLAPVWLIMDLLHQVFPRSESLLHLFGPESPLVTLGIVYLVTPDDRPLAPLLARQIELDDGIIKYLGGFGGRSILVEGFVTMRDPGREELPHRIVDPVERKVQEFIDPETHEPYRDLTFLLVGEPEVTGTLIGKVAHAHGRKVLEVDLRRLQSIDVLERGPTILRIIIREARLERAVLSLRIGEGWQDSPGLKDLLEVVGSALASLPSTCFVSSPFDLLHDLVPHLPDVVRFTVELPSGDNQIALWHHHLARHGVVMDIPRVDAFLATLAQNKLDVAELVKRLLPVAYARDKTTPTVTAEDFKAAISQSFERGMGLVMSKVTPAFDWDDIVLPDETLVKLNEIISFSRYKRKVLSEWGFEASLPYGKALTALFHGPPGTGKSMMAHIIAKDLGLELYRVDLAGLISKYVGETEKNLKKVFELVKDRPAILLFEEADSVFSKRTEVKDSMDRHSNVEVNYLLQMMEEFEGISVLTTNYLENFDEAFKRRIRFKIYFPLPDEEQREVLWRALFPADLPRDDDIHYELMARRFSFSPAFIKNSILRAAFNAAEMGTPVTGQLLFDAAVREAKELGVAIRDTM